MSAPQSLHPGIGIRNFMNRSVTSAVLHLPGPFILYHSFLPKPFSGRIPSGRDFLHIKGASFDAPYIFSSDYTLLNFCLSFNDSVIPIPSLIDDSYLALFIFKYVEVMS